MLMGGFAITGVVINPLTIAIEIGIETKSARILNDMVKFKTLEKKVFNCYY